MQPFFGSYVTLVNVHCIVASFLPIYSHLSQKCLFLFKMAIQPIRLVLQQKQPHQQLHLNKVSFKLLKGYVSERLRLVPKKILYASASFVSFKYTPKLWLELQCSVYWLLSDLCHQLDLKNTPRKSVPSSEWRGGWIDRTLWKSTLFYAWNVDICQRSFWDEQLRQINQIPSIKWQSKDILLSYSTVSNPHVGVWCHAINFYMITANGIVRGIDESSSDAEFKENSSQKVIICSLWLL